MDASAICPQCDHPAGTPESLERHSVRCPNGGQRHYMHAGLVQCIAVAILLMAGVPKSSIVLEKKGLGRSDRTRPGDNVVALDFFGLGRHLVIDAVVTTAVYRNTILSDTSSIPAGHAARRWRKTRSLLLNADKASTDVSSKHCGDHTLVPFAMEDGGTLGAQHAQALLKSLAEYAVAQGCFSSPDSRSPLTHPVLPCRSRFGCSAGSIASLLGYTLLLAFPSKSCAFACLQGFTTLQASR